MSEKGCHRLYINFQFYRLKLLAVCGNQLSDGRLLTTTIKLWVWSQKKEAGLGMGVFFRGDQIEPEVVSCLDLDRSDGKL